MAEEFVITLQELPLELPKSDIYNLSPSTFNLKKKKKILE